MKKLNKLNYNDIFDGVNFSYKNFIGFYKNGYVTLYYKNKDSYINTFMTYSNNIEKIKNEVKNEIKKHDIKELLKMSIDTIKNNTSITDEEIEKLYSYVKLENDKNKEHKKINKYLMNEIKEYFIFRLVRK
jgi:hypothetical protein